jgi:hypothetical protein
MSTSTKDSAMKPASETSKDSAAGGGRIVHDSRGNAVWSWDKGSDPSSTATTSKMLRKLDLPNLKVEGEPDAPAEEPPPAATKRPSGYGPGYNPYDRTAPVRTTTPVRSMTKK